MNIFIGNLSSQTTENQLQSLFAEYGAVKSVKIINDSYTGRPRGFAFVEMQEREAGENAVAKLNNTSLNAQPIVVNEARPRTDRYGSSNDRFGKKSRY